jgi:hypothetical protein
VSASHPATQVRRPGRPPACPQDVVIHVIELRGQGLSYAEISAALNGEGVPTPTGRLVWQNPMLIACCIHSTREKYGTSAPTFIWRRPDRQC